MNYNLPIGYLSPSQAISYLRCPACYELRYVRKLPRPMSIELPIGGGVHRGVQVLREDLVAGDLRDTPYGLRLEEHVTFAVEHYERELTVDDEVADAEVVLDLGDFQHEDQGKDEVARISRFGLPLLRDVDIARRIVAAEVGICSQDACLRPDTQFSIPEENVGNAWPFPTTAFADGLYGTPEAITLLSDVKTAKRRGVPDAYTGLQAGWYLRPWHLSGQNFPVMIDQFVKTVQPQYHCYAAHVTPEQHAELYRTVLDVAAAISAGSFPPRPGWWCSWDHGWPSFSCVVDGYAA